MKTRKKWLATLNWAKSGGLLPAIVQNAEASQVLMLGYMNKQAFQKTLRTGLVTFYSRTRQRLWTKGERSGHTLTLVDIVPDCDGDALLVRAKPQGPTCHKGTVSCFNRQNKGTLQDLAFCKQLELILQERRRASSRSSYTASLFKGGLDRIAQKVGEEAVETILASKNRPLKPFQEESADLLFHFLVLLEARNTSLKDIVRILEKRHLR